jgi:hypothetical protein
MTAVEQKKELIRLAASLLQDPPTSSSELDERYQKIRSIIEVLEPDKERLLHLLGDIDADFSPVRRMYPYHSGNFPKSSVVANEYRFFVRSIESYIQSL